MDMLNEFQDETYNQFLIRKAEYYHFPILGTFELTPLCNMKCKMCYIQQDYHKVCKNGGLKSMDFWEKVIDEAIDQGMLFCLLTGGEIFTYPHFKELYEKLKQKGIHIVLNTNATLLDEDTVQWLAKNPPRRLNISLYGADSETYERLCLYKDGFDKVINAFDLLKKYHIDFRVHGVLVPSNINDYEGIKDICNHYQVPLQMSYYMFPPVRKDLETLEVNERFTTDKMAQIAFMNNKDKCTNEKEWANYVKEKCQQIQDPTTIPLYGYKKIRCKSGSASLWVNWKGQVSGCNVSDENNFDLEKMSLADAWKSIREYTVNTDLSSKCSICPYQTFCPTCSAAAFCETGSVDGTPQYLCDFCKEYAELLMKEHERLKL